MNEDTSCNGGDNNEDNDNNSNDGNNGNDGDNDNDDDDSVVDGPTVEAYIDLAMKAHKPLILHCQNIY